MQSSRYLSCNRTAWVHCCSNIKACRHSMFLPPALSCIFGHSYIWPILFWTKHIVRFSRFLLFNLFPSYFSSLFFFFSSIQVRSISFHHSYTLKIHNKIEIFWKGGQLIGAALLSLCCQSFNMFTAALNKAQPIIIKNQSWMIFFDKQRLKEHDIFGGSGYSRSNNTQ